MKIYIAELRYGSESIAEFTVEEKQKTYMVVSTKNIIGWHYRPKMIRKDDDRICMSLQDAMFKIEAAAKLLLDTREQKYKEALEKYNIIHEAAEAIRLDPSKLDRALAELEK